MNEPDDTYLPLDLHQLTADEAALLLAMLDVETADAEVPAVPPAVIPPETAQRITQSVTRAIRRGDLGGDILRFSTAGFVNTVMALVTPMLNSPTRRRSSGPKPTPAD